MKTWTPYVFLITIFFLTSCSPDEHAASASQAPAAYIPPPENVSPPPAQGSGEWIGPGGFERGQ
ncbi:MAG: hypothetical protein P1U89_24195 [Verrucomicrobiales bacterium]|nr:hypothetical protein [Verrucomicrobiales bacterium]